MDYKKIFCWTLIFLAGAIWIFTVALTSVQSIEPSDLGLVSKMPPYFWIGLTLLGFLFYAGRESKEYLFIAFFFTVLYLFVAPAIIREPVWLSNSFYPFAESMLINNFGHLMYRLNAPLFSYIRWPVFLYFSSAFTLITNLPHAIILKYFPTFTIFLFGLLTLLILKVKLETQYAIFGAAWLLSSFWLRQQYFGPQGLAYIFFLMFLLLLSWIFFSNKSSKRRFTALLIFLFTVIVMTHVLTAIMSLIAVFALYLTQKLITKSNSLSIELVLLLLTIFFASTLFASQTFSFTVKKVYRSLSGIGGLSIYHESKRIIGSPANDLNYLSSWTSVLLNVALAMVSMLFLLKDIVSRKKEKDEMGIFYAVMLCLFGVFALTMQYGSHEAYQRAFMFGLIPLTYLCIKLLKNRPKILVAFLMILFFLNFPAQYGADSFRLASESQLAGAKFTANSLPKGSSCFDELSLYVRHYGPLKRIRFKALIKLPFTSFPKKEEVNEAMNKVEYIVLSDLQEKYYLYYLGENPLNQVDFNGLNRIYDNGNFSVLKHP